MLSSRARGAALAILLCGWIALSQHRASDGSFWYRTEHAAMPEADCRALLKHVTLRPKVGLTKWYDVSPQQLATEFNHAAVPTSGSWLACWPEGTVLGEPDA